MNAAELSDWLVGFVADLLDISPTEVDVHAPFDAVGVDSAAAMVMAADLSVVLERKVTPTDVWDRQSIELLAAHLAGVGAEKLGAR